MQLSLSDLDDEEEGDDVSGGGGDTGRVGDGANQARDSCRGCGALFAGTNLFFFLLRLILSRMMVQAAR